MGVVEENVRRNVRYLIELSCKEFVRRISRYSIKLRAVRSLLRNGEVFDRVGSCKENVRRNVRYLIELRAVRSLLEGLRGIRLSWEL